MVGVFFPFSAILLVVIISILRPDHAMEILNIINNEYGISNIDLCIYSILIIGILTLIEYTITYYKDAKKEEISRNVHIEKERLALMAFFKASKLLANA